MLKIVAFVLGVVVAKSSFGADLYSCQVELLKYSNSGKVVSESSSGPIPVQVNNIRRNWRKMPSLNQKIAIQIYDLDQQSGFLRNGKRRLVIYTYRGQTIQTKPEQLISTLTEKTANIIESVNVIKNTRVQAQCIRSR